MTVISKLLATSAIVVALGAPAMALDVNTTADLGAGITLHDNNRHNGGPDSSGIDLSLRNDTATADLNANVTGNAQVAASAEERASRFLGKSVISSEGVVIGTVSQARANADGGTEVVVALADGIRTEARQFTLDLAANVSADSDLKLGWTQAELVSELNAQARASASG